MVTIKEKFVFFKEIKMQLTYSAIVSLRINPRGFSEGKSEAGKQATTFELAKNSNFLYTSLLAIVFISVLF